MQARGMRMTLLLLLTAALSLVLVAAALAWRAPTRGEQQAITLVAERAPHAGHAHVRVSNIRVSTVGPWASATVALYFGNEPDDAIDILHRVHGKWTNASTGTAGEWCVMPTKDQRNLGFSAGYPCGR